MAYLFFIAFVLCIYLLGWKKGFIIAIISVGIATEICAIESMAQLLSAIIMFFILWILYKIGGKEKMVDSGVFSTQPNNMPEENIISTKEEQKTIPIIEAEESDNETEVCFKKIIIEKEQLLSSFDIAMIRKTINDLPAQVKRIFFNNRYKIRVQQYISNGDAAGQCDYNNHLILLDSHNGRGLLNQADDTICHELGHMIDYNYTTKTFASNSVKFKEIYNKEKLAFNVDYNYDYVTRDSQEYFAQSFSEYIRKPWQLKNSTPKTYEFMKEYIKNL